jgi:hypothetical protein
MIGMMIVSNQRGHDRAEGGADDDPDREVDHIAFQREFAEFV